MTLIEKLESASEGSRELDAEIAVAIGAVPQGAFQPSASPDPGTWGIGAYNYWTAPHYTTSIDVALTLVPEGWFLHDLCECVLPVTFKGDRHDPTGLFQTGLQWRDGGGHMTRANGLSPALALCIAALKARKAQ